MKVATSGLTAQGRVSVPSAVRKRLGLAAGSVLERDVEGDAVSVRRAGRYSSEEIHRPLFSAPPKARTLREMKERIRQRERKRHSRD